MALQAVGRGQGVRRIVRRQLLKSHIVRIDQAGILPIGHIAGPVPARFCEVIRGACEIRPAGRGAEWFRARRMAMADEFMFGTKTALRRKGSSSIIVGEVVDVPVFVSGEGIFSGILPSWIGSHILVELGRELPGELGLLGAPEPPDPEREGPPPPGGGFGILKPGCLEPIPNPIKMPLY